MTYTDTFLKYHNAGINWKCLLCGQCMSAVVKSCVNKCKDSTRPFAIVEVVTVTYFDGVEERWKRL